MEIDFTKKIEGLVPAIIQDERTQKVLMLGYMNLEAILRTKQTQKITFYSRTKKRLWTKGEESGNFLNFISMELDCDRDCLLIQAKPEGPTCHKGSDTCWNKPNKATYGFLSELEATITKRRNSVDNKDSYVSSLFKMGINKIAQKVGEEAVETVIEAKDNNDDLFLNESADLLFHILILLQSKGYFLEVVIQKLEERKV